MPTADLVLKNAKVVTVDPKQPTAELVAIQGDKILLVGRSEQLDSVTGARTKVIDCRGKTIVPGFNDAHCHVYSFVRKLLSIDLSPSSIGSINEIKAALGRRARDVRFMFACFVCSSDENRGNPNNHRGCVFSGEPDILRDSLGNARASVQNRVNQRVEQLPQAFWLDFRGNSFSPLAMLVDQTMGLLKDADAFVEPLC